MRDTEVLRRRLWLATGLWLAACDGGQTPTKTAKKDGADKQDKAAVQDGKGPAEPDDPDEGDGEPGPPKPVGEQTTYIPPFDIDQIPEGEFDYFGPSRDPFGPHEE